MDKAKILKLYDIDDSAYQGTCSVIGLKNLNQLNGIQVEQFDVVRGWLEKGKAKTFDEARALWKTKVEADLKAEAKAKAKAEKEVKPTEGGVDLTEIKTDILKEAEPTGEENAKAALKNVVSLVKDAQNDATQFTAEALMANFNKNFIKGMRSPEFQQQLKWNSDKNRETIEAEFSEVQDEMPALPPTQPQPQS